MPKADATELAPRNRLYDPPVWQCQAGGSIILPYLPLSSRRSRVAPPFKPQSEVNAHFIGEAFERRPWAMKIARLFLPGLFGPFSRDRIPVPPIRASILSHLEAHFVTILRNPLGKIERRSDESNVRHYTMIG